MRLPPLPPVRDEIEDEIEDARTFKACVVGICFMVAAGIVLFYVVKAAV